MFGEKANRFWHHSHSHKTSTDSVSSSISGSGSGTGFHDGYIYKIINQYDDSVINLEHYKTAPGAVVTAEEDTDADCQRWKASRIREGEVGGEFELQSLHQNGAPGGGGPGNQVWEYRQDNKTLVQNTAASARRTPPSSPKRISSLPSGMRVTSVATTFDENQLWVALEKAEGSRVYFIKPRSENVCLTNMGVGQPIGLYPPDPSDLMQHWVLEPMDYAE